MRPADLCLRMLAPCTGRMTGKQGVPGLRLHACAQDAYGQVNPYFSPPPPNVGVQPQKVAFTLPGGSVQNFLASPLM